MPGGFTWADVLAGYQAAGQTFLTVGYCLIAASFLFGLLWIAAMAWRNRQRERLDRIVNRDSVRAMAHERMARREAIPDWGQDGIYPDSNLTHRRAS